MYTDSHTHLYLDAFEGDRDQMIQRALDAGVTRMLLPNIDSSSIAPLFSLAERFPDQCLPMMGLHPTSVKENYREELRRIGLVLRSPGPLNLICHWLFMQGILSQKYSGYLILQVDPDCGECSIVSREDRQNLNVHSPTIL